MPFVTEEIWHKLPGTEGSIMKAAFPSIRADAADIQRDTDAESQMSVIIEIISGIRNIRGEMNIAPSLSLAVVVRSNDPTTQKIIENHQDVIVNLAKLKSIAIGGPGEKPKASATAVVNQATLFVSLEGIIDFVKETERLEKEINKLDDELTKISFKLGNEAFLEKAPAHVVAAVQEKHALLDEKKRKLRTHLDRIKEIEA